MPLNAIGRKVLLRTKHGVQRKIARQLGLDEKRVSAAANGEDMPKTQLGWKSYRRIQRALARALDLSLEEAFQPHELGERVETESAA